MKQQFPVLERPANPKVSAGRHATVPDQHFQRGRALPVREVDSSTGDAAGPLDLGPPSPAALLDEALHPKPGGGRRQDPRVQTARSVTTTCSTIRLDLDAASTF